VPTFSVQSIKKEVDSAVAQAKQSEIPQPDALWHNIYREPLGMSVKGLDSSIKIKL
jgi:TPP-dependent pyruvate/acetoin dehydrogenase alpha subunit